MRNRLSAATISNVARMCVFECVSHSTSCGTNITKQTCTCFIFAPIERQVWGNVLEKKMLKFYLFRSHENEAQNWNEKILDELVFSLVLRLLLLLWNGTHRHTHTLHTLEWLFRSSEDARYPITQWPKCRLFSYRQIFGWKCVTPECRMEAYIEGIKRCKHDCVSNDLGAAVHRLYFKFLSPFGYWFSILLPCAYVIEYIFWLSHLFSIKSVSIYFHTHSCVFFSYFLSG